MGCTTSDSMISNWVEGHLWLLDKFGETAQPKIGWSLDPFGQGCCPPLSACACTCACMPTSVSLCDRRVPRSCG